MFIKFNWANRVPVWKRLWVQQWLRIWRLYWLPMKHCATYVKPRWFVLHLSVSPNNAISFLFCRFTICLWTLASWTTHILSTPLITATTSGSLDWSRANPCLMSLTYEFLSMYEAPVWQEEPCKCVYVCKVWQCVCLFIPFLASKKMYFRNQPVWNRCSVNKRLYKSLLFSLLGV